MRRNALPKALHRYFWNVDAKRLNIRKYRQFVIERILEFGDERATRWLRRTFGDDAIRQDVCQSRRISKRTANFWCLLLNIPKERVTCLSKRSLNPLKDFWSN